MQDTGKMSMPADLISHMFTSVLPQEWLGYEARPGQLQLAMAVSRALDQSHLLVAEAGTGTGKTLAYLVPLLRDLDAGSRRVVVATATIALQEQIFAKDLPQLAQVWPVAVKVALAKGKSQYLCRWRLGQMVQLGLGISPREVDHLLGWAHQTQTGDLNEVEGLSRNLLGHVCVDDGCIYPRCPLEENCFWLQARRRVWQAQLIICNQHLLLSDIQVRQQTGGQSSVLPEYQVLVVDEAHHLPGVASEILTIRAEARKVGWLILEARRFSGHGLARGKLQELEAANQQFFASFCSRGTEAYLLDSVNPNQADDLLDGLQWLWEELDSLVFGDAEADLSERRERLKEQVENLRQTIAFIFTSTPGYVSWVEAGGNGLPSLNATPIAVAEHLRHHLFNSVEAALLTSATLATGGNFDYFKQNAGLETAVEVVVPSPFDFRRQCLLYLPRNLPEPESHDFYPQMVELLVDILEASRGRALLLFTSFRGLTAVFNGLSGRIPYHLLRQGDGAKASLLEAFRQDVHSVLLATASFWEGVDVPGPALSCVVMDRIPFAVPTHPVYQARLAAHRQQGKDPFWQVSLPEAAIKLKQGFGRLIRSRQDRGVVAIMDRRVFSRSYGNFLLASLPDCAVTSALEDVRAFFAGEGGPATGGDR
ncbi:MAG: ATP-dependent DNA helicase [Clostridia bacterium]|nr:MAG: ATP-dependent DNA helicase [Clostridia bacterium]